MGAPRQGRGEDQERGVSGEPREAELGPGGGGAGALLEQVQEEMGAETENWKWRRLLLFQVLEM